jgi:hypothetical protein
MDNTTETPVPVVSEDSTTDPTTTTTTETPVPVVSEDSTNDPTTTTTIETPVPVVSQEKSSIQFTFETCLNIIESSLQNSELNISKITDDIINIDCVYVTKFRHFLNNLLNIENTNYLEIGQWNNSSICSAMCNNKLNITYISYYFYESRVQFTSLEHCRKNITTFFKNLENSKGENNFNFIEQDYFTINISNFPKHNIFFYDGDKYCKNIYNTLIHYYDCLDDTFIFCINIPVNYKYINDNIQDAILKLKLKKLYERDIIFCNEDSTICNNFYIAILQK